MNALTEQLMKLAGRHRRLLFCCLGCLLLLSAVAVFRASFTNDVIHLFPRGTESGTTFRLVNESHLADAVQLEFISEDDISSHEAFLDAAASRLAGCPLVRGVLFRYRSGSIRQDTAELASAVPGFYPPSILDRCDPDKAAEEALRRLAFPVPGGVAPAREQPFGLERDLLERLGRLERLTGMKTDPALPYFASPDRRRAMIVLESDIVVGDADSVRALERGIRAAVGPLPAGLSFRMISGGNHTLGNEAVLKRDATVAGMISIVLFLLLFLVFYRRDPGALWIPLIPFAASLIALGATTFFFREICWYVVGLGSCITGLAVDQGIHVYAACRGRDPLRESAELSVPMMLSAATSIFVFLLLALTGIMAYVQLAVFAGISLVLSCVFALFLLPFLPGRHDGTPPRNPPELGTGPAAARGLLILILACGAASVPFLRTDFSLDSMDGTPADIREAERDFNAVWRSPECRTAVVAVSGTTPDEALSALEKLASGVKMKTGIGLALSPVPSESVRRENLARWRTPETTGKIADLEKRTRAACLKHGLPEVFFQPFFDRLRASVAADDMRLPAILQPIARRMLKIRPGCAVALALMRETPENISAVRTGIADTGLRERAAVLSRESFRQLVKQDLGIPFLFILPLSAAGAVALAFLVFRRMRDVLLAMTPVAAAFGVLAFLCALTRFRITPAAAFALILLTGLAVDYGIYAVHLVRCPEKRSIRGSVLLSAATTAAGAGALLFSRHPVLFGTGAVLSAGIAAACFAGLYLVPFLASGRPSKKTGAAAVSLLGLLLISGCRAPGVPLEKLPDRMKAEAALRIYPHVPFKLRANAVYSFFGHEIPMILAADADPVSGKVSAAGISPGGTLLFRAGGSGGYVPGAGVPDRAAAIFKGAPEDLCRIFCLNPSGALAYTRGPEYIILDSPDGTEWRIGVSASCLVSRGQGAFPFRRWRCFYEGGGKTVRYENFQRHYSLLLTEISIFETRMTEKRQ